MPGPSRAPASAFLVVWDQDGSGWERKTPEWASPQIQQRLDTCTWAGRSAAVTVVPEIEEWIWCHPAAVAKHSGLTSSSLMERLTLVSKRHGIPSKQLMKSKPKELFEEVPVQESAQAASSG